MTLYVVLRWLVTEKHNLNSFLLRYNNPQKESCYPQRFLCCNEEYIHGETAIYLSLCRHTKVKRCTSFVFFELKAPTAL